MRKIKAAQLNSGTISAMKGHPTAKAAPKQDPIRERYFRAVDRAGRWATALFYSSATLSVAVSCLRAGWWLDTLTIAFVITAPSLFCLGLAIRLHWAPRAADQRRLDLLSRA